ncbi:MAG: hypothetical protein QW404_00990 [Candidatus Nanoarchaeia archaeon]
MPKGITRGDAERFLNDVPEEYQFWVNDGTTIRNMEQLADALRNMNEETFRYHSNKEKSDFSNWLKDIVGDEKLARDLMKNKNKISAYNKVKERVSLLKRIRKR